MDLLYTTNTDGAGAVFAERDHAESVARLHAAFRTATTWGELRAGLTPEEYAGVLFNNELGPQDVGPRRPVRCRRHRLRRRRLPGLAPGHHPSVVPPRVGYPVGQLLATHNGDAVEFLADRADESPTNSEPRATPSPSSDLFCF